MLGLGYYTRRLPGLGLRISQKSCRLRGHAGQPRLIRCIDSAIMSLECGLGSAAGRMLPLHKQPGPSHRQRKHHCPQEHLPCLHGTQCRQIGPCAPTARLHSLILLRSPSYFGSGLHHRTYQVHPCHLPCSCMQTMLYAERLAQNSVHANSIRERYRQRECLSPLAQVVLPPAAAQ